MTTVLRRLVCFASAAVLIERARAREMGAIAGRPTAAGLEPAQTSS